jgi:DNA-binding transcriptional regulator YhcF (GntR family)
MRIDDQKQRTEQVIETANRLRFRILADLHLGLKKHGDRLETIRSASERLGVDHRIIARSYQRLENEGLVEIRGRSGIYLVEPKLVGRGVLAATAQWLSTVLAEAWARQMDLPDFAGLITKCVASGVRCACIDSTEDHAVAFCAELDEDFGLETSSLQLTMSEEHHTIQNVDELREALKECDVVVTTAFVHIEVRKFTDPLNLPTVVISVHPEMQQHIEAEFGKGPVGVVVADARYGHRIRQHFGLLPSGEEHVHVYLASSFDESLLSTNKPVFMTRAARRQLGHLDFHLLPPPPPFISPTTAKELTDVIVQVALGRM